MSDNVSGADNQQETLIYIGGSSETIRRAPFLNKQIVAYLQGALHDASFNKNQRFRFSQKGKEWLLILKELFRKIEYNSWIYKEGRDRDVYVLETLANFLDFNLDPLSLRTKAELINYVRGFFDAEGGIPHKKENRFYIQLSQKDKLKLEKIKKILLRSNIQTGIIHNPSKKVDPEYWRMYILTESHKNFARVIGSWHPNKVKVFQERMKI